MESSERNILEILSRDENEGMSLVSQEYCARFQGYLERKFLGKLRKEDVEEALQDACVALIKRVRAGEFSGNNQSLGNWIFRCAENSLIDVLRTTGLKRRSPQRETMANLPFERGPGRELQGKKKVLFDHILECLPLLTQGQRQVIEAGLEHGNRSNEDLGWLLGKSANSIGALRSKGISTLRKLLHSFSTLENAKDKQPGSSKHMRDK